MKRVNMKPAATKYGFRQFAAAAVLGAIMASFAHGAGNWVIQRDDKIDSPIFKQRPMIANQEMSPAQEQGYFAERYAAALQDYQSKIRRQWPNAEVSSATRWVSYSDDFNTRRVVDFKSNHIEISLETHYKNGQNDIAATRADATSQVETLLAMRIADAEQQDPVAVALADAFAERGADRGDTVTSPLVFPELFASDEPDTQMIADATQRLMQKSRILFQALSAAAAPVPVYDKHRITYLVPLPDARLRLKAKQYQGLVQRYASQSGLPPEGVMAMIHAESYFNPLARSHLPAFGLMQVAPSTMGREATAEILGEPHLLSPDYLLNAEKNIEVGTALLGRLYHQEAAAIRNPQSRWYFVQSIYKIGLPEAARYFDSNGDADKAMASINTLQPSPVLQRLMRQDAAPALRDYLAQVQQYQSLYKSL